MFWDKQTLANSVDPDQMLHRTASDQGLHCLLIIKQILETSIVCKMDLPKGLEKYVKELGCPNIQSKYGRLISVWTDSYGPRHAKTCLQAYVVSEGPD